MSAATPHQTPAEMLAVLRKERQQLRTHERHLLATQEALLTLLFERCTQVYAQDRRAEPSAARAVAQLRDSLIQNAGRERSQLVNDWFYSRHQIFYALALRMLARLGAHSDLDGCVEEVYAALAALPAEKTGLLICRGIRWYYFSRDISPEQIRARLVAPPKRRRRVERRATDVEVADYVDTLSQSALAPEGVP